MRVRVCARPGVNVCTLRHLEHIKEKLHTQKHKVPKNFYVMAHVNAITTVHFNDCAGLVLCGRVCQYTCLYTCRTNVCIKAETTNQY